MVNIDEVAEDIYMIDDQLHSIPKFGSVYLLNEEKKALIESGPTTSANAVLDGIRKVGVRTEDIAYIITTHIHLDHAGGAGFLLKDMPQAQVVVHHSGARHLVNPAKLISSVIAAQGKEAMEREGEVVPIREHRVQAVYDGNTIRLSDRQVLKFIDAPGHAPHELCIYESRNNGQFTGDAAGLYINGVLLPSTPPPAFDLELSINTLRRLMTLNATMIYFSHFGTSDKVQEVLQLVIDKLQVWGDIVVEAMRKNELDSVAEKMIAQVRSELGVTKETESLDEAMLHMCAAGYIKYYQERHKA